MSFTKTITEVTIKSTLSSGIFFAGLTIVTHSTLAATLTVGCEATDFCTLAELFHGGSIQVEQELLSDWSLVSSRVIGTATNFDFNNIVVQEEDPVSFGNGVAYYANNRELSVFDSGSKSFSYHFKVTSSGNNITEIKSPLRFRSVVNGSQIVGSINVGTVPGSNDIGSATSVYNAFQDINGIPVSVPSLSSFWVNTDISVFSDSQAELGYLFNGSQGRAYQQLFQLAPASVSEPSSILALLAFSTLGAGAILKRKLKQSQQAHIPQKYDSSIRAI